MTLYLDVIWLLNWLFDCLLLYWTAIILKKRAAGWRIILGGLIGSSIVVFAFTPYHKLVDNLYMKLLFSVFMIIAVFGFIRLKVFLKNLASLYLVTFLSGGILLGLHYLFQFKIYSLHPGMAAGVNRFGDPVSWTFVMIGFPLAWQFSRRAFGSMEMTNITYGQMARIYVKIDGFECTLNGLIDSGNQLYDPLSRAPVMIVSINGIENAGIPNDVLDLFQNPDSILQQQGSFDYTWSERMRIIPSKVVGNDHQLLIAVKPDSIKISHAGKEYHVHKGLISFTVQKLSSDDSYQCIVHPKMLTGMAEQSAS
ncbi:sigma-E processing peptidase SpoIIGA [Peribacillus cavernae]|uniref:Sporulation sigma-E factor-processing peptidase n=1 Tax=Peribacillus cavernae TaxID=1674310 RepID=A0A3S0TYI6_9BACI|nr:sigma-E processing peptidase SpoIIGA [Peribacillus cavernae]MDQ0217166.1 stage II sporulation protein GA (sporulation sigma-E factor processing peptidase) [Peribacillus cavernae]RUQ30360.1 sigma-E processing peptidase SpoIIGA [Peribacillus cavernae]